MLSEFAQCKNRRFQTQWMTDRFFSCFFSHLWISCDLHSKLFSFRLRSLKHIFQQETLSTISCTFLSIVQSIHNRCKRRCASKLSQPTFLATQHGTIYRARCHAPHSTTHDLRRAVQRSVKISKNYRVPQSVSISVGSSQSQSLDIILRFNLKMQSNAYYNKFDRFHQGTEKKTWESNDRMAPSIVLFLSLYNDTQHKMFDRS